MPTNGGCGGSIGRLPFEHLTDDELCVVTEDRAGCCAQRAPEGNLAFLNLIEEVVVTLLLCFEVEGIAACQHVEEGAAQTKDVGRRGEEARIVAFHSMIRQMTLR